MNINTNIILYHISDINIKNNRIEEYKCVFDTLVSHIASSNIDSSNKKICVITGSTFHTAEKITSTCINTFLYLIRALSTVCHKIITICDETINSLYQYSLLHSTVFDSSTAGLNSNSIFIHLNDSGVYSFQALNILVCDVAESLHELCRINSKKLSTPNSVNLCIVNSSAKYSSTNFAVRLEKQSNVLNVAAILSGGKSEYTNVKFSTFPVVYPGSLIQQNISENFIKGCVRWSISGSISETKIEYKFIPIYNNYGFIHFYINGSTASLNDCSCENRAAFTQHEYKKCIPPNNPYKIYIEAVNPNKVLLNQLVQTAKDKYKLEPNVISDTKNLQSDLDTTLTSIINSSRYKSLLPDVLKLHKNNSTHAHAHAHARTTPFAHGPNDRQKPNWYLKRFEWSNFLCYGDNNIVDFSNITGLVGLIASHTGHGKTAFFEILIFALFNIICSTARFIGTTGAKKATQNDILKFIRTGSKANIEAHAAQSASFTLIYEIDSKQDPNLKQEYILKREFYLTSPNTLKEKITHSFFASSNDTKAVYDLMQTHIGTFKKFILIVAKLKKYDIINYSPKERLNLLIDIQPQYGHMDISTHSGTKKRMGKKLKELNSTVSVVRRKLALPRSSVELEHEVNKMIILIKGKLDNIRNTVIESTNIISSHSSITLPAKQEGETGAAILPAKQMLAPGERAQAILPAKQMLAPGELAHVSLAPMGASGALAQAILPAKQALAQAILPAKQMLAQAMASIHIVPLHEQYINGLLKQNNGNKAELLTMIQSELNNRTSAGIQEQLSNARESRPAGLYSRLYKSIKFDLKCTKCNENNKMLQQLNKTLNSQHNPSFLQTQYEEVAKLENMLKFLRNSDKTEINTQDDAIAIPPAKQMLAPGELAQAILPAKQMLAPGERAQAILPAKQALYFAEAKLAELAQAINKKRLLINQHKERVLKCIKLSNLLKNQLSLCDYLKNLLDKKKVISKNISIIDAYQYSIRCYKESQLHNFCNNISTKVNSYLASVDSTNIFVLDHTGNIYLNNITIEACSASQQFIVSFLLRLALFELAHIQKPSFLIIDEEDSIDKIISFISFTTTTTTANKLFEKLLLSHIFLVSHSDVVMNAYTTRLELISNESKIYINSNTSCKGDNESAILDDACTILPAKQAVYFAEAKLAELAQAINPYICEICKYSSSSLKRYEKHMVSKKHAKKASKTSSKKMIDLAEVIDNQK